MQKLKIIWDQAASNEFSKHITYIRNDSPKNADKVKKSIIDAVRSLLIYPEKHPPDKDKIDNAEINTELSKNIDYVSVYRFMITL